MGNKLVHKSFLYASLLQAFAIFQFMFMFPVNIFLKWKHLINVINSFEIRIQTLGGEHFFNKKNKMTFQIYCDALARAISNNKNYTYLEK